MRDRASFGQAGSRPRLRQDGEREANSSQDTPDKQDPTQYKRAASVGTGSLVALASGTDEMAARVLNENIGRGLARSASVLWTDVEDGKKKTAAFDPLIDKRAAALLDEVKAAYQLQAAQRGVPAAEPTQSAEEREAANLLVEPAAGGGGRGRGAGGAAPAAAPAGRGGGAPAGGAGPAPALPQEMNAEFAILLGQRKTALEIRDFLSGEFTPLPLADLMAVLRAREAAGTIRLTPVR